MIPVYIGYDPAERVAYHVLEHSIRERTRADLQFAGVGNTILSPEIWRRERGPKDSTQFSNARFMVPWMQAYRGWAIFMDCDMLCLADIEELWAQRDDRYALMCVKHNHVPKETTKFLGAVQTQYGFKNWSSLMLLNTSHPSCRNLTLEYVNRAPGLDLHQFAWTATELIGEIKGGWNVLSTPQGLLHPEGPSATQDIKLIHYTHGGPWHGYFSFGAGMWTSELRAMLAHDNPRASIDTTVRARADKAAEECKTSVTVSYGSTGT